MQYIVHANGMQLTAAIKTAALDKFGRLERIAGSLVKSSDDAVMNIELSRTTHHHHKGKIFRAELHMPLGRKSVYAASEGDDLYEAMDHAVAAAKKQLLRLKG